MCKVKTSSNATQATLDTRNLGVDDSSEHIYCKCEIKTLYDAFLSQLVGLFRAWGDLIPCTECCQLFGILRFSELCPTVLICQIREIFHFCKKVKC